MATTHNPSNDKLVGDLKSLMSDAEELLKLTADQQGGKLDDLRDGLENTVATVRKLPGLVTRAEAALDDYDAEKRSPQRGFNRFMFVAGFWLIVIVAVVYLVRVVFNL